MIIKEMLEEYAANGFFILDSHQEAMYLQDKEHRHNDKDMESYAYNTGKYNQLKEGSFVLFRRPGKWTEDGKFSIYGGGIIDNIEKLDNNKNVKAIVKCGFYFDKPIMQGDYDLENYDWKIREKPGPGWKGFWVNYGMNRIEEEDFWWLIGDRTGTLASAEENNSDVKMEDIFDFADFTEVERTQPEVKDIDYKKYYWEKVIDYMESNGIEYNTEGPGETVFFTITDLESALNYSGCRFVFDILGFTVYAYSECKANLGSLEEMLKYLHMANYGLTRCNFEYDVRDGEIRVKNRYDAYYYPKVTDELIEDSINYAIDVLDAYGNGIVALSLGFSTAEDEIKKVDGDNEEDDDFSPECFTAIEEDIPF